MHRFCKFGSKVGSVSRAQTSPAHTGKQAGGWTNALGLSISFNPSAYLRPEEMAFSRLMWLVNLQLSSAVISFWSEFPVRQIVNVQDWGPVCRFEGKTCGGFRAFTTFP
jgi:hypothetical protein